LHFKLQQKTYIFLRFEALHWSQNKKVVDFSAKRDIMTKDRARRGAGGALHLQSATAGLNCLSRALRWKAAQNFWMMMSRSCAMVSCEPCQSLTAAALSKSQHVPQGSFGGVQIFVYASATVFKKGCTI